MPVFWFAVLLKQFGAIEMTTGSEPRIGALGVRRGHRSCGGDHLLAGPQRPDKRPHVHPDLVVAPSPACFLADCGSPTSLQPLDRHRGSGDPELRGLLRPRSATGGPMILAPPSPSRVSSAVYSRFTRASMLETLKADYVRTAKQGASPTLGWGQHPCAPASSRYDADRASTSAILAGAVSPRTSSGGKAMGSLFVNGLRTVDRTGARLL